MTDRSEIVDNTVGAASHPGLVGACRRSPDSGLRTAKSVSVGVLACVTLTITGGTSDVYWSVHPQWSAESGVIVRVSETNLLLLVTLVANIPVLLSYRYLSVSSFLIAGLSLVVGAQMVANPLAGSFRHWSLLALALLAGFGCVIASALRQRCGTFIGQLADSGYAVLVALGVYILVLPLGAASVLPPELTAESDAMRVLLVITWGALAAINSVWILRMPTASPYRKCRPSHFS